MGSNASRHKMTKSQIQNSKSATNLMLFNKGYDIQTINDNEQSQLKLKTDQINKSCIECDKNNKNSLLDHSYYGICSDINFELNQLEWKFNDNSIINNEKINSVNDFKKKYAFIKPENTFYVKLKKGSRGLGLSVCGGIDSHYIYPGLMRIKRLFPNEIAFISGQLDVGDLILAFNDVPLIGLKNYEALEILRRTENDVTLTVCRPPKEILNILKSEPDLSPPPPPLPKRDANLNDSQTDLREYEVILNKINGSLGFTLQRDLNNGHGHFIRALVKDPARSNHLLRPGDKILSVNDVDISFFTHEEAVQFLRTCENQVRLRLQRNEHLIDQVDTQKRSNSVDMSNDMAVMKTFHYSSNSLPRNVCKQRKIKSDILVDFLESTNKFDCSACDNNICRPNNDLALTPVLSRKPARNLSIASNTYELSNFDLNANNEQSTTNLKFDEKIETLFNKNNDLTHCDSELIDKKYKILEIELYRGWNSRLGFSLQEKNGATYVTEVHKNSLAAKDGRIKKGDCIIKINDESVGFMSTNEIIYLLRYIRGPVSITIYRQNN